MCPDRSGWMCLVLGLVMVTTSEGFFLKWGSDSRQSTAQKPWVQPMSPNIPSSYRYQQYVYSPYESRKVYQIQASHPQYSQPEVPIQQSMAPIPISVPAGASLTPVSLQHVQLVPCMCPVAPEEAEKLQEQVGPGPYLAQTYTQSTYVPQQVTVAADNKLAPKP
ncbi:uncharacterized protein LOC128683022 isoform X1 [Plodia interpunctella]|uniref:uncharacterized protein LOC128683022 isoform X1 n=1 Tax=Plodia interpunctella TaxID=58824 RepID=UPI00236825ED|nr:uncharacterized protein LOC128683022 isoform X1 [Plodia interpunctella]